MQNQLKIGKKPMMAFTDLLRLEKCLTTINSIEFVSIYKELIETELDEYKKYPDDYAILDCIEKMRVHLKIEFEEGSGLSARISIIKGKINDLSIKHQ